MPSGDILDRPGGQCTELYPEKPIYDIPGLPIVTGQELTNRLLEQVKRSIPSSTSTRWPPSWKSWKTAAGNSAPTRAPRSSRRWWWSAAGAGSFQPKRPPVPGIEAFENAGDGIGVHYAVRKMETFRGKNILIAGGGDSAPGLGDQPRAAGQEPDPGPSPRRLPRAAHSVNQMRELEAAGKVKFHVASVKAVHGEPGKLTGVTLAATTRANGIRRPTPSCPSSA